MRLITSHHSLCRTDAHWGLERQGQNLLRDTGKRLGSGAHYSWKVLPLFWPVLGVCRLRSAEKAADLRVLVLAGVLAWGVHVEGACAPRRMYW